MIPYCRHQLTPADRRAVTGVLESDRLTQGPAVPAFEAALARRLGARDAVAVSSGTSALVLALRALGVRPGNEVIVPSLTFVATANAVLLAGATPVFADVDPTTLTLAAEGVDRARTPRTVGAIQMHFAGHPGDVERLRGSLGSDAFVLEDACHALGAERDRRPAGMLGDAGCFSFHPAKHVTTGEGGAVVFRDPARAAQCRRLREHGVERQRRLHRGLGLPASLACEERGGWVYEMHALSGNHRLSDLGAALGTSQLDRLDALLSARRALAARYDEAFANDERVRPLRPTAGTGSAWHLYAVRLEASRIRGGRAAVHAALHASGVAAQVHYIPVHLQPFYRARFGSKWGDLPVTEAAYLELLSLPLYPDLTAADQAHVVAALRACLDRLAD